MWHSPFYKHISGVLKSTNILVDSIHIDYYKKEVVFQAVSFEP